MASGKTLLIVSGGIEAADAAKRAKDMGHMVVVSDIDPNAQEDAGEPGAEQQQAAAPAPGAAGTTRLVHPKNGG